MTAKIDYGDIPKEERKRLAAVIRGRPTYRAMVVAGVVLAIVFSRDIADRIVPTKESFWLHFTVDILVAGCLAGLVTLLLIRPFLKREIEKAKNA